MVGHFFNMLLMANILMAAFVFCQGLKCYYQRGIKVEGVAEDSMLNFALKGLFGKTDNQPETERECLKSEEYCGKMSCDLGNGIYVGAKSCAEKAIELVPDAECNQQSNLTMAQTKECNLIRLMAKVCSIKYCSTDLCNAGGTAASTTTPAPNTTTAVSSAGALSSSFEAVVSTVMTTAMLGLLWCSVARARI